MQRLDAKTDEEAKEAGWQIAFGAADASSGEGWVLVQKAWHEDEKSRTLHTTKRMVVPGAWIYETTTTIYLGSMERHNGDAKTDEFYVRVVSVSKALTTVPFPELVKFDAEAGRVVRDPAHGRGVVVPPPDPTGG